MGQRWDAKGGAGGGKESRSRGGRWSSEIRFSNGFIVGSWANYENEDEIEDRGRGEDVRVGAWSCDAGEVTQGCNDALLRELIGTGTELINLYRNRVAAAYNFVFERDFKKCSYGQI